MSLEWSEYSALLISVLGVIGSAIAWSWKTRQDQVTAAWEREEASRASDLKKFQVLHSAHRKEIDRLDRKVTELRAELDRLRQYLVEQERVIRYYEYHTGWPRPVFTDEKHQRH